MLSEQVGNIVFVYFEKYNCSILYWTKDNNIYRCANTWRNFALILWRKSKYKINWVYSIPFHICNADLLYHPTGTSVNFALFLSISVNPDWSLLCWSMRKYVLKHTEGNMASVNWEDIWLHLCWCNWLLDLDDLANLNRTWGSLKSQSSKQCQVSSSCHDSVNTRGATVIGFQVPSPLEVNFLQVWQLRVITESNTNPFESFVR